jgi:hypothetical protein
VPSNQTTLIFWTEGVAALYKLVTSRRGRLPDQTCYDEHPESGRVRFSSQFSYDLNQRGGKESWACLIRESLRRHVHDCVGLISTGVQRHEIKSQDRLISRPDRGRQPTDGCEPLSRCAYTKGREGLGAHTIKFAVTYFPLPHHPRTDH